MRFLKFLFCPILFPCLIPIGAVIGGLCLMIYTDFQRPYQEISPASYDKITDWTREYPDLSNDVQKYNTDGEIAIWEYDRIEKSYKRLQRQKSRFRMMKEIKRATE